MTDAVPHLTADQSESALARLREAGYAGDHPLVAALVARVGDTGGVRRRNRVARWFGAGSERDERRATRQQAGTVAEQHDKHRDYLEQYRIRLEAATRGQMLKPRAREKGVKTDDVLNMTPTAMRANLSEEALRFIGENQPPLNFDAWRYANLGARDRRAVASWQKRTGGFFSEHG